MADRYWVGGTGTWSTGSNTNWSTTSGGSGGASSPGTSDRAIFNGSSGGGTVTTSSEPQVQQIITTGFTGNIVGSVGAGSATFASGQNFGSLDLRMRATIQSPSVLTTNGAIIWTIRIVLARGATSSLGSSATASSQFLVILTGGVSGTAIFNTNGYTVACSGGVVSMQDSNAAVNFNFSNSPISTSTQFICNFTASGSTLNHTGSITAGTRVSMSATGGSSMSLSGGNITVSGDCGFTGNITASNSITQSSSSNTTLIATSGGGNISGNITTPGSVECSGTKSGGTTTLTKSGGTQSLNITGNLGAVVCNSGNLTLDVTGGGTMSSLTMSNFTGGISFSSNFTISSLQISGSVPGGLLVQGVSGVRTLTSTSYTLSNISWQNITGAGTIPFTGSGFVDLGGNTNIQFSVPGNGLFFGSNF